VVHTDHELGVASYYLSMAVSPQPVWLTDAMLGAAGPPAAAGAARAAGRAAAAGAVRVA
jgi:hypothetical protein